jgi:malate permease and related proteins
MNPTIAETLPVISLVMVGFLLKTAGIIRPGDGAVLIRFILNTTLPAVIFLSVAQANVEPARLGLLAFCGFAVALGGRWIAGLLVRWFKIEPQIAGVIILGTLVMNVGAFLFPVVQTVYGAEGVSRLAAFDIGNSLVASGYGYYLASQLGTHTTRGFRASLQKVLSLPILWAALIGLVLNLSGLVIPTFLLKLLKPVASANAPLSMLALGAFLELRFAKWNWMALAVTLRMGVGFLLGNLMIWIANLQGFERLAVLMGSATPVGMVTLVFAVSEGLDAEFAARIISLSILVGLISMPLLLLIK